MANYLAENAPCRRANDDQFAPSVYSGSKRLIEAQSSPDNERYVFAYTVTNAIWGERQCSCWGVTG